MRREHIVDQIREIVHRVPLLQRLFFMGQRQEGDAREDSDIDLLVLLDKEHPTLEDENVVRTPYYERNF